MYQYRHRRCHEFLHISLHMETLRMGTRDKFTLYHHLLPLKNDVMADEIKRENPKHINSTPPPPPTKQGNG